jgi:hypothetical protein
MWKKYKKKPVIREAFQWFSGTMHYDCVFEDEKGHYVITVHNQKAYLAEGDWVIKEPSGDGHYPCKPDIFEKEYDPA